MNLCFAYGSLPTGTHDNKMNVQNLQQGFKLHTLQPGHDIDDLECWLHEAHDDRLV
jgi:hypothetical protein